jgi:hypothetical protein
MGHFMGHFLKNICPIGPNIWPIVPLVTAEMAQNESKKGQKGHFSPKMGQKLGQMCHFFLFLYNFYFLFLSERKGVKKWAFGPLAF